MTRLALPAILVIGAFSAALAAPVSASPWSPTGTPTPLPEHSVASSQAHRVSSIDVHSRELTTRELAVSTSLEPKTRSNPNLIARDDDDSVVSESEPENDEEPPRTLRLSDLTVEEIQALREWRPHREVPKRVDATYLDLDDWQTLVKYWEAEVEAARKRLQEAKDKSKIQGNQQSLWLDRIKAEELRIDLGEEGVERAKEGVDLAKKKVPSLNAVPKPYSLKRS
ncbi:hypothetical protein C8R42DRAFT_708374 [Lentinula raphanica]|nr:hypothetical protein C8R42DRAFT_708374 [Lentinula raphanica]